MLRKVPLIVILGSTGTGKTKLSLELAQRYGGEIISADSMQVYANLDIVTAKATKEEQSRAKHHLLDVATPNEPFTVLHFRNKALPIIENLLAESKCPIVVGGTNYYIESLLWNILVSGNDNAAVSDTFSNWRSTRAETSIAATLSGDAENLLSMSPEVMHQHLKQIDPVTADRIHPNNKRKIMRAIEFYQQTGQTLSAKLSEQRQQPGGSRLGGPLRYPHTILLWLRCNQDVLNARLEKRIDGMLQQGLLREIRAFHNEHNVNKTVSANSSDAAGSENTSLPVQAQSYTVGILQTIGFKEFVPYLNQFNVENDLKIETYLQENAYKMPTQDQFKSQHTSSIDAVDSAVDVPNTHDRKNHIPAGLEILNSCLNELKLVTRRYSRNQVKWINNRFLASRERQVPDMYELDTTDVSQWQQNVYCPAETIINCYRSGEVCEIAAMEKTKHRGEGLNEETSNFCSICQRHFIGEFQWHLHLKSNKHKRCKDGLMKKKSKIETSSDD